MKPTLFLFLIIFISSNLLAQKAKVEKTNGESLIEWTDELSKNMAKQKAKDEAIVNAIENAFGSVVVQGNATYISNVNTGEKVETQTRFKTIGESQVKGEMVELLKEEYEILDDGDRTFVKCKVKIKAREIVDVPVDFQVFTLSGERSNNKAELFKEGDSFYLYFRSPNNGYLSVYLDDTETTVRILPYQNMPSEYETGIPIKADKEYIFFSKAAENSSFENDYAYIDELELYAESQQDINRLFVLFSDEPLNKPFLDEAKKMDDGYIVPKSLSSEDFQKWKNKNQSYRNSMQIKILDIIVQK